MSRRVALFAILAFAARAISADAPATPSTPAEYVQREAYVMGTRVRLAVWSADRVDGLARLEAALDALERADAELSTWRDDSAIAALNRTPAGASWHSSAPLCETLSIVSGWQRRSEGAFDPAIGRLIAAWDIHGAGRIPTDDELARARAGSGFAQLGFDPVRCAAARRTDVTIDVGAFGKGDALGRAGRVVGDRPWMIDLGGQIAVQGAPPGESGWPVAIAHPLERDRPHLQLRIREGSLATSGGSERDLAVEGRRVSHILDPRTGRPAVFRGSVTVWDRRPLVADILSTALFVMGPDEGLSWAEARGIAACYLAADTGGRVRATMSRAFKALMTSESVRMLFSDQ